MIIESSALWLAATNSFVVAAEPGGPAVVIDQPPDLQGVARLLARHDLYPVAALVTHGHVDHCGGTGEMTRRYDVKAFLHPADEWLAAAPIQQMRSLFGMQPGPEFAPPDSFTMVDDDEVLSMAGVDFTVVHTPGHTPGHICFYVPDEEVLFSGDQLFAGSIGRTDLPGGDFDQLMRSMAQRVMTLPDEVRVLPGHGPETTIGRERRTNPFLRDLPPVPPTSE